MCWTFKWSFLVDIWAFWAWGLFWLLFQKLGNFTNSSGHTDNDGANHYQLISLFCLSNYIIEQVASNKSRSLMKMQKQNTQTLQLFTKMKQKVFTKLIEMPSLKT
jgi:hypothetical protein